jgi:hypothetical protein
MTQSKNPEFETTIDLDDLDLGSLIDTDDTITINLDDTYGATTTYWAGDSITDVTIGNSNNGTFSIDINDITTNTLDLDWVYGEKMIKESEVTKMSEHYPALEKAYRNFKHIYDMVKQDYEGKIKAGEIDDDDIPF